MTDDLPALHAERRDPARNMARFYAIELTPTLFGDLCLTRRWGRIGTSGQMKAMSFADHDAARAAFARLAAAKARRGYGRTDGRS